MADHATHGIRSTSDLAAAIRDSTDAVAVVGLALLICREREDEYWEAATDEVDREIALHGDVVRVLDPVDFGSDTPPALSSWRLNRAQAEAIGAILTSVEYSDLPLAVAARAVARALDHAIGPRFVDRFAGRVVRITDGVPYPVGYVVLPDEPRGGRKLVARPDKLPPQLEATTHLRLGTVAMERYEVVIDFRLRSAIAPAMPAAGTVMATVHPNATLADLLPPAELSERSFFGVRPQRSDQQAVIARLIEVARRAGAHIVVLPELSVDADTSYALGREVRAGGIRLLVAGSFHHTDEQGRRHNEAVAYIADHPTGPITHRKIVPFVWQDRKEDLHRPQRPRLTVYASGEWRMAICICRDLLDPALRRILEDLQVNLLLLPALSDDIVTFKGPIGSLVGAAQAIAAVANGPHGGAAQEASHCALFGHPVGPDTTPLVEVGAGQSPVGVALFRPYVGELAWVGDPSGE